MIRRGYRARQRILSDDELRTVWRVAAEHKGPFDFLVQFILLTAARRCEASDMTRREVQGADWIIEAPRYKTGSPQLVPLSARAQCLLAWVPKLDGCPFVFTTDGERPMSGFSKLKASFDKRVSEANGAPLSRWTLHDLRRTSRTLLSRAGVSADHAERCIGHVIGGVRGVYDLWQYAEEKRQGFEALATLLDRILHSQANVVAPSVACELPTAPRAVSP